MQRSVSHDGLADDRVFAARSRHRRRTRRSAALRKARQARLHQRTLFILQRACHASAVSDTTEGSGNFELRALIHKKIAEHRRQCSALPLPQKPKSRLPAPRGMFVALAFVVLGQVIAGVQIFSGHGRSRVVVMPAAAVAPLPPVHVKTIRAEPIRAEPTHAKPIALNLPSYAQVPRSIRTAPSKPVWRPRIARPVPMPRLLSFLAPGVVLGGASLPVAFRASGSEVRVVAKVGPSVIADATTHAGKGTLTLRAPATARTRVLTLNVYVERSDRIVSASRTIIVLPPA